MPGLKPWKCPKCHEKYARGVCPVFDARPAKTAPLPEAERDVWPMGLDPVETLATWEAVLP